MAKCVIGSNIIIDNPEFFIRCGYPLDYKTTYEEIRRTCHRHIYTFLDNMLNQDKPGPTTRAVAIEGRSSDPKAVQEILRTLTYCKMRSLKFGGNTRSIYTKRLPLYLNMGAMVEKIRYVRTGNYNGSYGYGEDFEPASLEDQRSHRILQLNLRSDNQQLEIEDINVTLRD